MLRDEIASQYIRNILIHNSFYHPSQYNGVSNGRCHPDYLVCLCLSLSVLVR
jgi:hypothetical protein